MNKLLFIKFTQYLAQALSAIWFGVLLAKKIDLTTADLGRHIKNGQLILNGLFDGTAGKVLHTNFYSYTHGSDLFINHHWLSGVVLYLANKLGGFPLLSLLYIVVSIVTLWLFFASTAKQTSFAIRMGALWLLIVIMSSRAEVRPEMFTYLFCGIFFFVLWRYHHRQIDPRWLWLLPLIELIWVNLHIGFIYGIFIVGVFALPELFCHLKKQPGSFLTYCYLGIACIATALINPSFIRGFLYPFIIFRNYGYKIVENQSVTFLESIHFTSNMNFALFKVCLAVTALSFITAAIAKQYRYKHFWILLILTATFAVMAWTGIRNFPLFGFFALPALAVNISALRVNYPSKIREILGQGDRLTFGIFDGLVIVAVIATVAISFLQSWQIVRDRGTLNGTGLLPGIESSAQFFINTDMKGPIFNNYDVGGYLIYYLYPHEKVFVDNRPEAYSADFFNNVYILAQQDPAIFKKLDDEYHFNTIFFSYRDYTPWGQQFLIGKINDPNWAPVFADSYNIIFLRRNNQNAGLIKQYELPKSIFGVTKQ